MTQNRNNPILPTETPPKKKYTILSESASKIFIWAGIAIILIGFVLFLYHGNINPSADLNSNFIAQLGDFVGGVAGSLWALAGVILFYVALEKQKEALDIQLEEFALQREELQLQRNELKETRAVFQEQSKTQQLAQFETSFYNLLELFKSVVSELKIETEEKREIKAATFKDVPYSDSDREYHGLEGYYKEIVTPAEYEIIIKAITGRKVIKHLNSKIGIEFDKIEDLEEKESIKGKILKTYFVENEIYLLPYFYTLLEILVKIDTLKDDKNRLGYFRIFKALFTFAEDLFVNRFLEVKVLSGEFEGLWKKYFGEQSYLK